MGRFFPTLFEKIDGGYFYTVYHEVVYSPKLIREVGYHFFTRESIDRGRFEVTSCKWVSSFFLPPFVFFLVKGTFTVGDGR